MYITHAKTIQAIEKAASGAATVCLFYQLLVSSVLSQAFDSFRGGSIFQTKQTTP